MWTIKKIESIGGKTLEQLRKQYQNVLFDHFVPNMDRFVIDHEFGGFMTTIDIRTGKRLSSAKRAWYEGRGIWVYSFLYNNFEQDPHFLKIARKSKDFIMGLKPSSYQEFWKAAFTHTGNPITDPGNPYIDAEGDIYGNLFIAEGLAEYARASVESQYLKLAKKIILAFLACYDCSDYSCPIIYGPSETSRIQAPRVLGHWMIFLRSATQMLEYEPDQEIEELADRCVDAIMNFHLNSNYGLVNEGLNHDLSLPDNAWTLDKKLWLKDEVLIEAFFA